MRDAVKVIERGGREELSLPDGLECAVSDAEMLMVHLCPVTKALIEKAPKLKYILCNRGGVENVDVEAARAAGMADFTPAMPLLSSSRAFRTGSPRRLTGMTRCVAG